MKKPALQIVFSIIISIVSYQASGTTYWSKASGHANVASNWNDKADGTGNDLTSLALSGDLQLVIQSGHSMTTSGNASYGEDGTGTASSITIESGGTLTASHDIRIRGASIGNNDGDFTVQNGGTYVHNTTSNDIWESNETFGSTSTVELKAYGTAPLPNTSYGDLIVDASNVSGDIEFLLSTNETITINGDLIIKDTDADDFGIGEDNADNVTLLVKGNFELSGGSFDFWADGSGTDGIIQIEGNLDFTGGTWNNSGQNNLEVQFTGSSSADVTFEISSSVTLSGSVIADTDWSIGATRTVTMLSNFEIGSGEDLNISGRLNTSSFHTLGSGDVIVATGGAIGIGSADGIDDAATPSTGSLRNTGDRDIYDGNLIYNGTSAQATGDAIFDGVHLSTNLQIANTSGAVTLSEDVEVEDGFELIIDSGATFLMPSTLVLENQSGTVTATINGTLQTQDQDGFSAATGASLQGFSSVDFGANGTVEYNRSGTKQTITNQFAYNHVIINNGSPSNDFSGTLDIDGNLTLSGSSHLELDANTLQLAGDLSVSSNCEIEPGTGTLLVNGSGTQTLDGNGTLDFYKLIISSSDTASFNDPVDIEAAGELDITQGVMDMKANKLNGFLGTPANTGNQRSLSMSGGTLILGETTTDQQPHFDVLSITGGTIELGASGNQVLHGGEIYNNLTFSGSGTKTISSATQDINGNVFITESCTLDIENKTFGDGAVGNPGNTTLSMDGGHFIIEGGGSQPSIDGTYSLTGGTIEFSGSSSQNINSPQVYHNVVVSGFNTGGSSGNYTLNDGGTFTIESGGVFSVTNQRILSSGTATLTVNGTFNTADNDGFSGTNNTESVDENTMNITLGSTSTIGYNSNSGTQSVTDRDDYANVTLSQNASKSFSGTPEIAGNLTVGGGSVSSFPSTITYDGTSAQEVPGQNFGTSNIVFSGGGDKELQGNATMNGTITFTSGNLVLGNHDLTIGSSATVSSANASSYVQTDGTGKVIRSVSSSAVTFPIGQNPYLPVTIEITSGSGGDFAVSVADGVNNQPDGNGKAITTDAVLKTWNIETPSGSNTADITLQWNNGAQNPDPGASNNSNSVNMGFEQSNASTWDNEVVASNAANPSSGIYAHTRNVTLNGSSEYVFGIGSGSAPLPVELIQFTATLVVPNDVELQWTTASEVNNSHFVVLGSDDGKSWTALGRVEGYGNSISQIHYSFTDQNALYYEGQMRYYRLQQFDYDGTFEYSEAIEVRKNNAANTHGPRLVKLYQNQQHLHIRLPYTSREISESSIQIVSLDGQVVHHQHSSLLPQSIELNSLPSGVYILQIHSPDFIAAEKFTWQR